MMKNLRNHFYLYCCLLIVMVMTTKAATPASLLYSCSNTSYNPEQDPGYRKDLLDFLVAAPVEASRGNFFSNHTYGRVNGMFMCRGDVNDDVCVDCVTEASKEVLNYCSNQMVAFTWYDYCFLRYSNESFFSMVDTSLGVYVWNPGNVTEGTWDDFNRVLTDTINKAAQEAAADTRPDKKFGVEEAQTSSGQNLYTLAQCTPDLSQPSCDTCLQTAIALLPSCCENRPGGRVAFPRCNIRYEIYSFYSINVTPPPPLSRGKSRISVGAAVAIALSIASSIALFIVAFVFLKRRARKRCDAKLLGDTDGDEMLTIDPESLQYSLSVIQIATNNFSIDNKIGQGGFGGVYKGTLPNGQDIAVKRLSKSSGQGAEEFKNEIGVVAKLQHRNLVRLLGFCLEGVEKILVYEFVQNKSLDNFLFDPENQELLSWSRRRDIIGGIARGLLYLHEDSRLKIVHRDLKAGNILLDENMNPKIADFGMAKICVVDQTEGNTTRIAGTFGYMAPEYTRSGHYSVKSDVFSFGVVILEIIAGKKNNTFHKSEDFQDLLSYAWQQWRDGTPLALLDPRLGDSYMKTEVILCIHIGLLCVEEDADKRPTMASVVHMLNSSSVTLPTPYHPAIIKPNRSTNLPENLGSDRSNTISIPESINEASITKPYPR